MAHLKVLRKRRAFVALALAALWTTVIVLGAAYGFWRPLIAARGDSQAFARAAAATIDRDLVGNTAFVLLDDGKVVAEHFASQGAPVTSDTVFQLASLSKWVAAWGVMALVEDGKIDLDAPVETYLTRWHLPSGSYDSRGVTVRRLLTHTAGLKDDLGYTGFGDPSEVQCLEDSLTRAADPRPGADGIVRVGQEPGVSWRYSGGGFTLLQLLIEEVSGQSFSDYMRDRILRPLDMTHSGYSLADVDPRELALSYDSDGTTSPFRSFTALAAASLYSTATDMGLFLAAHQPGPFGEPVGRGVLSPETVAKMRTLQVRRFGLPIWGLGTMLYAADGQGSYVIGHEGGNAPAVTTTARFNPSTGDGLVILQTGRPALPVRLGADWIRWQTGRTDLVALRHHAPVYLALVLAGWLLIGLGAAVPASRWGRRIAVKLHGPRSAN